MKRPWGYVSCCEGEQLLAIAVADKNEASAVLANARALGFTRCRTLSGIAPEAKLLTRADRPELFA